MAARGSENKTMLIRSALLLNPPSAIRHPQLKIPH
jgi:hypothetical protein